MDIAVSIISLLTEFICIYIMARRYTETSFIPRKADILFAAAVVFSGCFLPNSYSTLLWSLGQILYLIYFLSQYRGTLLNRILLYILSMISMMLAQCLSLALISLSGITQTAWYLPLLGNLLTLLVIYIVFCFSRVFQLYAILLSSTFISRFIMLNTYIAFMALLLLVKLNITNFYQKSIYLLVVAILLVAANTCIIYYEQQLLFRQRELASYQKNLPVYQTLIDQIRASQHEYSNHLQTLHTLPRFCPDYDSLCAALEKYSKEYTTPLHAYSLLKINMPLLAASLYNQYSKACENGISILFNITTTQLQSTVPEHILTDFICILTQNAIEASRRDDTIYIYLYTQNGKTHFEIRNPTQIPYPPDQISQFFQKGYTTKKDGTSHGYGLYHLLTSIHKLHGDIGADCIEYRGKYWMIFQLEI